MYFLSVLRISESVLVLLSPVGMGSWRVVCVLKPCMYYYSIRRPECEENVLFAIDPPSTHESDREKVIHEGHVRYSCAREEYYGTCGHKYSVV